MRYLRDRSNPSHTINMSASKCVECGKIISSSELYESKYCKQCAEIKKMEARGVHKQCDHCNKLFPISKLDSGYCPTCLLRLKRCDYCRETFISENKKSPVSNGGFLQGRVKFSLASRQTGAPLQALG